LEKGVYFKVLRAVFIHFAQQITDADQVDINGGLIMGDTVVVLVIYFDDDTQLGKEKQYLRSEAQGYAV
jgi:hypothetical protein